MIRISGPEAIAVAGKIFRPASGAPLTGKKGYTISYGEVADPSDGSTIDQALASVFRAPHSYTGEDMVEISTHASPYIVRRVISLLIEAGARAAEAGEFTVRAFLAGKMDLSQAEAVADMITAADKATHAMAVSQIKGGFSDELGHLREELLRLSSLLELELDFSEEEVEFADRSELDSIMELIGSRLGELTASFALGNALKEGVAVAITGKPNAGKSTLLNTLLKEERAMVSEIAGTTRDVIEEGMVIGGVRFRFLDTAGIRHTDDLLEKMGIERTYGSVEKAAVVLWMVDAQEYLSDSGPETAMPPFTLRGDQRLCVVVNKIDKLTTEQCDKLHARLDAGGKQPSVEIDGSPESESGQMSAEANGGPSVSGSDAANRNEYMLENYDISTEVPVILAGAKSGINIGRITDFLISGVETAPLYNGQAIVSHARHHQALQRSAESIVRARKALKENQPADLLAQETRQALHYIGTITGEITTDEILGTIFSRFCIGK